MNIKNGKAINFQENQSCKEDEIKNVDIEHFLIKVDYELHSNKNLIHFFQRKGKRVDDYFFEGMNDELDMFDNYVVLDIQHNIVYKDQVDIDSVDLIIICNIIEKRIKLVNLFH